MPADVQHVIRTPRTGRAPISESCVHIFHLLCPVACCSCWALDRSPAALAHASAHLPQAPGDCGNLLGHPCQAFAVLRLTHELVCPVAQCLRMHTYVYT